MKKKPVEGYEKPGIFEKLFKKNKPELEPPYLAGVVPAEEPRRTPDNEEEVKLEGDVIAPIAPEEMICELAGDVPAESDED